MKALVNGVSDRLRLLSVFLCMPLSILLFMIFLVKALHSDLQNFAFQWVNLTFSLAVQIKNPQICCLYSGHFSCPCLQCSNGLDPGWEGEQTPPQFQYPIVPCRLESWCRYSVGTDSV